MIDTSHVLYRNSIHFTQNATLDYGGASVSIVTVVRNGHGDSSSNPKRICLHGAISLRKGMNPTILTQVMSK